MRARPLILLTAIAGLAGCTDNDVSIEITEVCSIPDSCSFQETCDLGLMEEPWVDLAVPGMAELGMRMPLEFRNNVQPNPNEETGLLNTKNARVKEFELTYTDGLTAMGEPITVPGGSIRVSDSDLVPAGGSTVIRAFGVLPSPYGNASQAMLAAAAAMGPVRIVANIVAKGEYLDGTYFETAPFEVPIKVYSGYAATYPYCAPGETVTSVCPAFGQYGTATCEAAP